MKRKKIDSKRFATPDLLDYFGRPFKVGDTVAKAGLYGSNECIFICKVTRIENERMYLDDSRAPIQYPGRCMILDSNVHKFVN